MLPILPPPPHRLTCGQEHIKYHTSFGGEKKNYPYLEILFHSLEISLFKYYSTFIFFFKFRLLSSPLNLKPYQHYFTLTWTIIPRLQIPASFHLVICYFLKSLFPIFNLSTPNLIVSGRVHMAVSSSGLKSEASLIHSPFSHLTLQSLKGFNDYSKAFLVWIISTVSCIHHLSQTPPSPVLLRWFPNSYLTSMLHPT